MRKPSDQTLLAPEEASYDRRFVPLAHCSQFAAQLWIQLTSSVLTKHSSIT